jgi:hypothetical protein
MNIIILLLILIIILIIIYYFIYNKKTNICENFYTQLSDNAILYRERATDYENQYNQLLKDVQGFKKQASDAWDNFVNNERTRTLYNIYLEANNNLTTNANRLNNVVLPARNKAMGDAVNAENLAAIEQAEIAAKIQAEESAKVLQEVKAQSDANLAENIKAGEIEKAEAIKIAKEKTEEATQAKNKADSAKAFADAAKIEADKADNDAKIAAKIAADALAYANSDSANDGIPEFALTSGNSLSGVFNSVTKEPFAFNKNEVFFVKI